MADQMRWRYGDTNPVVGQPIESERIAIGDLLFQAGGRVSPAAVFEKGAHLALDLPRLFATEFIGVAMQRSPEGEALPIRIATTGVFEFEVLAARDWELGDLVGAVVELDLKLADQTVRKAESNAAAIGRCAKRGLQLPSLLVDIRSTVMTGGVVGRRG